MITLTPVRRALVPRDSQAADDVSAPNYDEFQSDLEIRDQIQAHPESVLRVTMSHCDADSPEAMLEGDSDAALARAGANMRALRSSPLVRELRDILFVYEIVTTDRPDLRQIGLGGMARTDEIRTDRTPGGPIIRNEGVRPPKARGRARLIEATDAIIGTVNNAVPDREGSLTAALEDLADGRPADLETVGADGSRHRIWLVEDASRRDDLAGLLALEPEAYVADGNHRSAAAALLGREHFLAVFFPAERMRIAPYNRLVADPVADVGPKDASLGERFDIESVPEAEVPYQPLETHRIGLYSRDTGWLRLTPRPGTFDPTDGAGAIDHDIVQRNLFDSILGISDAGDPRLTFVGANRDAAWLATRVDSSDHRYAVTLPAVTMAQFIEVCRQGKMMPPKSTWFVPKIRSGLVMALL